MHGEVLGGMFLIVRDFREWLGESCTFFYRQICVSLTNMRFLLISLGNLLRSNLSTITVVIVVIKVIQLLPLKC